MKKSRFANGSIEKSGKSASKTSRFVKREAIAFVDLLAALLPSLIAGMRAIETKEKAA